MTKFTYASAFSGIGGMTLGLKPLGGEGIIAWEYDPTEKRRQYAQDAHKLLHPEIPVHGDICEANTDELPDFDVFCFTPPCFVAGTLITTAEGLKKIEDIDVGDRVLTHTNTFKDVVTPMTNEANGVFKLKVQGSPITYVTPEHPFYVREMYRTYNTVNGKRTNIRNWGEPKWVDAKDLKPNVHYVGFSENKEAKNPYNLTSEDAWLIGRYVADGYIRHNVEKKRLHHVVYCVGKDKIDAFLTQIESYHVVKSEDRTAYKCTITDKRLMGLCEDAGKGAVNKRVPGFIMDLPNSLLEAFLDGYMSGDGCFVDGNFQATSVSRELIYGLAQIAQKLYKVPSQITFSECPKTTIIEGRTVNQKDTWMIRFKKQAATKKQHAVYIDGMLWCPVRKLEWDDSFEGTVYNFEVADDNSYVANNMTVHNCQAFSVAGKRNGTDFSCTNCDYEFAPENLSESIRTAECPECGELAVPKDDRGVLTYEALRIAKAKKPKVLFMENVKGLINHDKGATMGAIIHAINEIGYTVDFTVLNSKYFDVAQNRERVYLIAIRDDLITPEPWIDVKGTTMLPKAKCSYQEEGARTFNFDWPEQTEVRTRLRDFLEDSVDERYYLSNDKVTALVTNLREREIERLETIEGTEDIRSVYTPDVEKKNQNGNRIGLKDGEVPTITAMYPHGIVLGIPIKEATTKGDAVNIQFPNSKTRRGRVGKQIANTIEASGINQGVVEQFSTGEGVTCCIDANYAKGTLPGGVGKGRRTHIVEYPQDDNDGVFECCECSTQFVGIDAPCPVCNCITTSKRIFREEVRPVLTPDRLEKCQNGRRFKEDGEESFTLTSIDRHGVAVGEYPKYRIRKLTPRECLRLQSVPEGLIDALSTHFSDSRLYKFAGNGLTTNVITAIGERLIKYL